LTAAMRTFPFPEKKMGFIDLINIRLQANKRLQNEMRKIYFDGKIPESVIKGLIPKERIREDFNLAFNYGIAAGYLKFIYGKNKVMVEYYKKLIQYKGLLKEWHELSENERNTWIIHKIPDFSMLDFGLLSQTEVDILKYSGKFTSTEMVKKLNLSSENMKNLLIKMNDKYLILFSAFI